MLTKFEIWALKKIVRKVVKQGNQSVKIPAFFGYLIKAAREEYTEDTRLELNNFLQEMFIESLDIEY